MKRHNAFILLMPALWIINACSIEEPISKMPPKNNMTYEVEYLFEHDGCKVYRFRDNGHYIYFTNCNGNVSSIENDSTEVQVVTNNVKK